VFISAKPSLSRWEQRADFIKFNALLQEWAKGKKNVTYADVWTPMLDKNKIVRRDLFIEDGLHMNATGYEIWTAVLSTYMR
jgi:lysophospholipase L1-like esterase